MSELWRRCPEAREHGTASSDYGPQWYCVCHGANGESLVPVAAGAVLIEDGMSVAVERMVALQDAVFASGSAYLHVGDKHEWMLALLRAAEGRET